ncbi:hypothetical protein [Caldicellulosiruptor bescii]|nr:hypothetical protein [Caldicellulosiruptor bescii]
MGVSQYNSRPSKQTPNNGELTKAKMRIFENIDEMGYTVLNYDNT